RLGLGEPPRPPFDARRLERLRDRVPLLGGRRRGEDRERQTDPTPPDHLHVRPPLESRRANVSRRRRLLRNPRSGGRALISKKRASSASSPASSSPPTGRAR